VTACSSALAAARLTAGGLPWPKVFVGEGDVPAGKPDPAGYLLALRRLGITADGGIAVEDAPAGVAAARAAGLCTIAVSRTHHPAELAAADVVTTGLDRITVIRDQEGLRLTVETNAG
jgi:sugar-phosphatase